MLNISLWLQKNLYPYPPWKSWPAIVKDVGEEVVVGGANEEKLAV